MTEPCLYCGGPVNPHDVSARTQVTGWVHGPKKDSLAMREPTGKYAHQHCVTKAAAGQPTDQPEMFPIEGGPSF